MRKITRILLKTLKYATGILLLILVLVGIGINTYSFQTWLGQKAGAFLSDQLGVTVSVGKVNLDFICSARLMDVYIEDRAHDTLFYGKTLTVNVSGFNYRLHRLKIDEVKLTDTKAHLIRHKGSDDFNFQFLVDYFSSKDTLTQSGAPVWTISYGTLLLDGIDFIYRNEKNNTVVSRTINFNNIHAEHIYGTVSGVHIIHDSIYAFVKGFRCMEQSGIAIEDLTVTAKVASTRLICKDLHLKTRNSLVDGTLLFTYKTWSDYLDFTDKVRMAADLEDSSKVSFTDIAYFAEELNGLDKTVYVKGKVSGYISDLKGHDMDIRFGENTRFQGNAVLKGLPDINRTYLHFDVKHLSTSKNDLSVIPEYPFHDKKYLTLPPNIGQLGVINYSGKFDGYINDFTSYGIFRTALGSVSTDLAIRIDTVKNIISYEGKVSSPRFNIGRLLGTKGLGNVSLDSKITGRGITLKEINATLDGKVRSIVYNGYTYQDISINGTFKNKIFKGDLISRDKNADLDFNGSVDFTNKVPAMDFISTVNKLNLKYLGFINAESPGVLSSQILINLKGDNIDNLTGLINFDNTIYKTAEKEFRISTFDLELDQSMPDKKIKLGSNILDLTVNGRFQISNMEPAVRQFLSWYYPAFFPKNKSKMQYADALQYKLVIKKFNSIRDFFTPNLMVSPGTVFEGDFDASKKLFNLNFNSDSIRYGAIKFNINRIESYSQNNKINLVFKSQSIQLTDSIRIYNYFMYVVSKDENTKYNVEWNNGTTPRNAGKFAGKFVFNNRQATMSYDDIFITVRDSAWKMTTSNPTLIDSSGAITVNPLLFVKDKQVIDIQGALSGKPSDQLNFNLSNFDLEQLAPFMLGTNLQIDGNVSGNLALHNNLKKPAFSSNLVFSALKLNNNDLGNGELKTEYNSTDNYVYLDGYTSIGILNPFGEKVKNISFSGYYYPDKKENSLDLTFGAQPASLKILNPYVKGLMTFNTALVTGEGTITGSTDKPLINGKFKIIKCDLKVDFTNVAYSLLGSVEVMPDQIRFEDITLNDNITKNKIPGTVSGNIFHNNFKNMRIDFDINYNNMLVLNTNPTEGSSFYGKAFASGSMGIYGLVNNVKLEINTKTEKGTVFNIPLDGPAEVADNNFIRFVTKDTIRKKTEEKKSGFSLDMNLTATPDAEVQIIFDAKNGDVIKARGAGDLNLKINNLGKFDMFGEYELTGGDYLFTLENFITKKFEIDKGSLIKWSGSPSKAEINIAAVYKQRASIAPLFPLDTTGIYKRRYPVNCKLYMKDKLMSPDISFGVELPSIDENTRSKIKAILQDETELNRQVFSLLLLKSFVTPLQYSSAGGISAGTALAANSSEMLSNRLSSWLNGLTKQVDIGVNYRPGGTTSSDELDIALSKQLLNNRLSVDGNLGVNNNQNKSTNGNGLIGDVNVEYKLTDDGRYRVKGFNRSNDNTQITTTGGPFTQGVGVFYREEFETWPDLYRRYLNKLKGGKNKDPQPPGDVEHRTVEATDPEKAGN